MNIGSQHAGELSEAAKEMSEILERELHKNGITPKDSIAPLLFLKKKHHTFVNCLIQFRSSS